MFEILCCSVSYSVSSYGTSAIRPSRRQSCIKVAFFSPSNTAINSSSALTMNTSQPGWDLSTSLSAPIHPAGGVLVSQRHDKSQLAN